MIRDDARVWVLLKDVTAVRRIVPPRCAELGYGEEEEEEGGLNVCHARNERRVMGYVVGSYVPKGF
jgi:hypothetical protein